MRLSSRTTTRTPRRALPNFTTGTSSTAKSFTFPSLRANQRWTARHRRLHTTAVDAEAVEIGMATEAGEAATEAEAAAGTETGLVRTDAKNVMLMMIKCNGNNKVYSCSRATKVKKKMIVYTGTGVKRIVAWASRRV
jgi:hypothetical protein